MTVADSILATAARRALVDLPDHELAHVARSAHDGVLAAILRSAEGDLLRRLFLPAGAFLQLPSVLQIEEPPAAPPAPSIEALSREAAKGARVVTMTTPRQEIPGIALVRVIPDGVPTVPLRGPSAEEPDLADRIAAEMNAALAAAEPGPLAQPVRCETVADAVAAVDVLSRQAARAERAAQAEAARERDLAKILAIGAEMEAAAAPVSPPPAPAPEERPGTRPTRGRKRANPKEVAKVLAFLRAHPGAPLLSEIAKGTGLRGLTVMRASNELAEACLIRRTEYRELRGRPIRCEAVR